MTKTSDVLIIGAGIVGLATAYQLQRQHPHLKIAIVEKEEKVAAHQTGHNSGVVHSGVYYKPGSLKAKNCVEGKKELLQFCDDNAIAYKKLGKVIVATRQEELPRLEEIEKRGRANGLTSLELIGPERLKEIEPHVSARKALWLPDVPVIHYPDVAQVLSQRVQEKGAELFLGEKVVDIRSEKGGCVVVTTKRMLQSRFLINCAGLFSDRIAKRSPLKERPSHQILPFRGEYYMLSQEKAKLVKGLIYPVPDPKFPFLGVHLTRMLDGKVEAGPNAVLAFAREGYKKSHVHLGDCLDYLRYPGFWKMAFRYWNIGMYEIYRSLSKKAFLRDLQRLVPEIQESDLSPGGAGIRAQVVTREGKMLDDFSLIQEQNMVHVLNAPSPAATACFSIGRFIASKVET